MVGLEHAVAVHPAPWYYVLVCYQYAVCKHSVGSVYVGAYGGPVGVLVVGESQSVLL